MNKFHWNQNNRRWIVKKNNYSSVEKFLFEKDADNVEWIILNSSIHLKQPEQLNGMFKPKKDFFCSVNSYIMTDNDFSSFKSWAKNQNFYGMSLPESHQCYKVYSREYCWSKAFEAEYGNDYDWTTISDLKKKDVAVVALTNYYYYWENEYDHSKRSLFSFIRPSKELCKLMGLRQGIKDGEFVDESGLVVCKNPSVNEKHPSCLMVRKKEFLNALKNNGLKIAWTILGEKRIASLNDEDRYTWMTLSGIGCIRFGKPTVKMNHFMNRVKS